MSRVTVDIHRKKWFGSNNKFREVVIGLIKKKKTKDLLQKVDQLLYPFELMVEARSNMKARAKLYSGDFSRSKK